MSTTNNQKTTQEKENPSSADVRLDKWLWAARFFKTRALSKQAIETGKVHYDNQRAKCSRQVALGAELTVRQGYDVKTVVVKGLSTQRRGASDAALLYVETPASIVQRETQAQARKAMTSMQSHKKPNKKERRAQVKFLDQV